MFPLLLPLATAWLPVPLHLQWMDEWAVPSDFYCHLLPPKLGSSCHHTNCRLPFQPPPSFLPSAAQGTADLTLLWKIPSLVCDFSDLCYCLFLNYDYYLIPPSAPSFGLSMAPLPLHVPQLQAPPDISPSLLVFSFYTGLEFIFVFQINTMIIAIPKSTCPESTFLSKFLYLVLNALPSFQTQNIQNLTLRLAPKTKLLPCFLISGHVITLLWCFQMCVFGLIFSFVPYISHHVPWTHLCHVCKFILTCLSFAQESQAPSSLVFRV